MTVGLIAGIVAFLPLLFILVLLGNLFLFLFAAGGSGLLTGLGGIGFLAIVTVVLFGLVYVVGLAAIGGFLGSKLNAQI